MNSILTLVEKCIEYLKRWSEHQHYEFQSFNTVFSDMKKNRMKCYTGKDNHRKKSNTNCNVNDAGISDKSYAFTLLFKKYMSSEETFNNKMGSNPHHIK